jgi:hypothetical protein
LCSHTAGRHLIRCCRLPYYRRYRGSERDTRLHSRCR